MFEVELRGTWLVARFPRRQRFLSWAVVGGFVHEGDTVVWHEVTNAELPIGMDPGALLAGWLKGAGFPSNALGFLTSARLDRHGIASWAAGGVAASCVATVGLSNARRPGDPTSAQPCHLGTINLLVATDCPLSMRAMVETVALAAEARAVAVLEAGTVSPVTGLAASGTGTDCIAVAAPLGASELAYAGKHTAMGECVGRAVLEAVGPLARRALAARAGGP